MMERDALGRPRKNLWIASRTELKPELPKLPQLEGPMPESKVLYDSGWTDGLKEFLDSGDPMAKGFSRFVQYVKEQRAEGRSDKEILDSAARFVHLYPAAVQGTTAPFAAGMRAALQSFRAQAEEGDVAIAAEKASRTPTPQEKEASRLERAAAREAKQKAKEAELARLAREAAARKRAKKAPAKAPAKVAVSPKPRVAAKAVAKKAVKVPARVAKPAKAAKASVRPAKRAR